MHIEMTPEDQGHIELICKRHGIEWLDNRQALQRVLEAGDLELLGDSFSLRRHDILTNKLMWRGIHIHDQDSAEENYFTALHELGHCVLEQEEAKDMYDAIDKEIEAWEWAFAHANYFPSDTAVCEILDSLCTYTHLPEAIARGEALGGARGTGKDDYYAKIQAN